MISCKAQAFCQTDANAGNPEDNTHVTAIKPPQQDFVPGKETVSLAQLRHQYVQELSPENFEYLVHRIGAAHAKVVAVTLSKLALCCSSSQCCVNIPDSCSGHVQACPDLKRLQYLEPKACQAYLQPDNMRPFSLKHAQQQASIVGHMQQAGLLKVKPSID